MGHQVIASVLEEKFEDVLERISSVSGLLEWVQIDVVDGSFAENITWPYTHGSLDDLHGLETVCSLELHLMVKHPMKLIKHIVDLPVKRVLLHAESFDDVDDLREALMILSSTDGLQAGVSLLMQTPVNKIAPLLDVVEVVQLMSIKEIGVQGNPFSEETYARIRELRGLLPDGIIEIDGGVSLENAPKLIEAGADNLVVGSGLFKHPEGVEKAVSAFKEAIT